MTIWAKGDPDIQLPPLHFNCRSRTLPYFGKIPGKRDIRNTKVSRIAFLVTGANHDTNAIEMTALCPLLEREGMTKMMHMFKYDIKHRINI